MTTWRTDIENIPAWGFDVIVADALGMRRRETDCIVKAPRQICSFEPGRGYEPVEYRLSDTDFRRVTHWALVELPDVGG